MEAVPAARRRGTENAAVSVRRIARIVGLVAVLALAGVLVVGLAFGGSADRLADGTTVAGVDVGGLTVTEARSELERRADAVERVPVEFVAGGRSWRYAASQLGIRHDWDAALQVAQQAGDGFRPVRGLRRLRARVGGIDVAPGASSFESVVAYTVAEIGRTVDRPAVDASLRRRGLAIEVVPEQHGKVLDRAAAVQTVVASLASLERGRTIPLPLAVHEPDVRSTDLAPEAERARVALAAPLQLEAGPTRLRLPRWRIARLLDLPTGGERTVGLGGPGANAWFAELKHSLDRPPRDATFRVVPGGIELVPARKGKALAVAAAVENVERALFSSDRRVVRLPIVAAAPERTTAEARAMGITGLVGSYTTSYGGTPGRVANVGLVAELIDGTLVAPGATFSFNQTTGERNAEKGFQEAPVIINGELRNGIGGGVCQVSTTVFNAAFEAGLPIDRRTNHALYISHYPLGRDATVNYPDLDLAFTNDTDRWLLLRTFVNPGSLTVNLYGTPPGRRVESSSTPLEIVGKMPVERTPDPELARGRRVIDRVGVPPRRTSVTRRVFAADGELLREDTWWSTYVGEPSLVRVGTKVVPKAKAKPESKPAPGAPASDDPVAPAAGANDEPAATTAAPASG